MQQMIQGSKFFMNILNSMNDIVIVGDMQGLIRFVNRAFVESMQCSYKDAIAIPMEKCFKDPDNFSALRKTLLSEGSVRNINISMVDCTGKEIPVSLNGATATDHTGRVTGMVIVARDMRDVHELIKELERINEDLEERVKERTEELMKAKESIEEAYKKLQQTQAQLVHNEKMASIGQLSAGIAHEINNPVGFVSSNLKTLEGYMEDIKSLLPKYEDLERLCEKVNDGDIKKLLQEIREIKETIDMDFLMEDLHNIIEESQEGMNRITKIVKDLKEFSHGGSDTPEYADINKCIQSTLNIVWNELKYKAQVKTVFGYIPRVLSYPQQLNQVFMNILVNSAQAIKEKGEIRIKTYTENGRVFIEFSDTGEGIPPENLPHIFEPFFTTKPVGKGTGLGLSIAYAIIQKHGGTISVKSEIGKGTCFTISLPVEYEKFKEGETP